MLGKSPRLSLAEPHQRRFNNKRHIKSKIERNLKTFERIVAAVRIPRIRNAWKTKEIPKKIRDLFTLLGLPLSPLVFWDSVHPREFGE